MVSGGMWLHENGEKWCSMCDCSMSMMNMAHMVVKRGLILLNKEGGLVVIWRLRWVKEYAITKIYGGVWLFSKILFLFKIKWWERWRGMFCKDKKESVWLLMWRKNDECYGWKNEILWWCVVYSFNGGLMVVCSMWKKEIYGVLRFSVWTRKRKKRK